MLAQGSVVASSGNELLLSSEPLDALQADLSGDGLELVLTARAELEAELRVYGPSVESVSLNGSSVEFTRDGDYVVLNVEPTDEDGGADAGTDAGPDGGADAGTDAGADSGADADVDAEADASEANDGDGCGCAAAGRDRSTSLRRIFGL